MKAIVVRYQAKPDRADENQKLIEAVFADLDARQPEGFTYKVFRLEDGVSFVHVVIEHDVEHRDSLADVPAFQAFVADIAERCDVPPLAMGGTVVGCVPVTGLVAAGVGRLHDLLAAHVDEGQMPGLVALVARGDDVHVEVLGTPSFTDPRRSHATRSSASRRSPSRSPR